MSCMKSGCAVFIKNIKRREFIFWIKEKKIFQKPYTCTVCTCILPKNPNKQNKKQCIGHDWEDNIACEQ